MMDRINLQNLQLHRLPFFHRIAGLLNIRNAQLRHRHEALDIAAEVDDDPLIHEAHDAPAQLRADGVRLPDTEPRIFLRLLQPQRDPFVLGVDVQNQDVDFVALLHDLGRMLHALGPRHVGDVNQAVDPRLDFHECAERREVAHLAAEPRADRILLRQRHPRVLLRLLHAERDFFFRLVDLEDHRLDRFTDLHELGGMRHAAVAHVGDVQQAVDAAEIDERPEVGDVLDDALSHLIDRQLLHQHVAFRLALGLEQHPARHDDVATPFVELDDLELEALAEQLVDVRHATQRDLAAGQERIHAHEVHDHTALDLLHQRPGDRFIFFVRLPDLLPDAHEVSLLLRQDDGAFLVLEVLQEDFDLVAFFQTLRIFELIDGDRAFGLEADVEDDGGVGHAQHLRFDDLAFFDIRERPLIQQSHFLDLVRGVFLIETGADAEW